MPNRRTRVIRWKAAVPLALFLALVAVSWYFFLDATVRRSIEAIGTELVGAKVDLAEVEVRLREGSVTLRGLQVTNPDAPMTNLFEVDEIVADVRLAPLLKKKIYIDTVAVRGLRFGTDRARSGALEDDDNTGGLVRRRVRAWADSVPIPGFSLEGLTGAVNVDAIRPEMLGTPQAAANIRRAADSARSAWTARLEDLNPAPVIDSAAALVERLSGASLLRLGVTGLARTVQSLRSTVQQVTTVGDGIAQLQESVTGGIEAFHMSVQGLERARAGDLANARSLLRIPSLDAPDISPALFTEVALDRVRPLLYWAQLVEQYLPPGLDPRRRPGPVRARLAGADYEFPDVQGYAGLTVAFAEVSMQLTGEGAAAGDYRVQIHDFSSAPSIHGRPIRISAVRRDASAGPETVAFAATLDHVTEDIHDSVAVRLTGVTLPSVTLPGIGAGVDFGRGVSEIDLTGSGDTIAGRVFIGSSLATWDRGTLGAGRVNDIVWNALSALQDVHVDVRLSGSVAGPHLEVRSNVAAAIAESLQRELRNEVAAAERRVRDEVNRLVAQPVADATAAVSALETRVRDVIAGHQQRLDEVKDELEARLRRLGG
ncbi:MAG: TIGR03545 family protein [Gemmatimonadetes bacterium]|nr:TIGR03545 family protein [Gemmatimonadota bacterium]